VKEYFCNYCSKFICQGYLIEPFEHTYFSSPKLDIDLFFSLILMCLFAALNKNTMNILLIRNATEVCLLLVRIQELIFPFWIAKNAQEGNNIRMILHSFFCFRTPFYIYTTDIYLPLWRSLYLFTHSRFGILPYVVL
jgi:hypothetical protein